MLLDECLGLGVLHAAAELLLHLLADLLLGAYLVQGTGGMARVMRGWSACTVLHNLHCTSITNHGRCHIMTRCVHQDPQAVILPQPEGA
jgi:hypothetical protein